SWVRSETTAIMSAAALTSTTDVSLIRATVSCSAQLGDVAEGESICHACDELDDLLWLLPLLGEVFEDPSHGRPRAFLLPSRLRAEIDPLEHERPQCERSEERRVGKGGRCERCVELD